MEPAGQAAWPSLPREIRARRLSSRAGPVQVFAGAVRRLEAGWVELQALPDPLETHSTALSRPRPVLAQGASKSELQHWPQGRESELLEEVFRAVVPGRLFEPVQARERGAMWRGGLLLGQHRCSQLSQEHRRVPMEADSH